MKRNTSNLPNSQTVKTKEEKKHLIQALIKGEKSKRVVNFDPKIHIVHLHKKYLGVKSE